MSEEQYTLELLHAALSGLQAGYLITDARFRLLAQRTEGLGLEPASGLFELLPELVGLEASLKDVGRGQLSSLRLEQINRATPEGGTRYLTLTAMPFSQPGGGCLLLVQDTTWQGQMIQQLAQTRNDLAILQRRLGTEGGEEVGEASI